MDINAAMSLQAMAENNPYKPRNSGNKGGKDFEQIFREASALKSEKKDLKNNGGLQESYSAVFNAGNAAVNPIDRINRINDYSEGISETSDMVMGVSETVPAIPAFSDITDAFADMISTELLSQYIAKNYPLGTGGQNPKEEFSGEVRDVVFDIMEDYSGFTKTQMNNPNMTADVMGLDKIVTDDFIEDITSDIISVVFNGDINDKQLAGQVIKNAVEQTMINPVNVVPQQEAVVNEEPTEIREVQPEQIPNTVPGGETVNYADNTAADSVVQVHENAMPVSDAEPIETDEPGVRMIAMTDGTYIPESAIMDSPNMPDANGIYPAGTQYIKATPYIGPGDSPAKAVLMAKVGDEDGLVRPSDFVKARGITFTPHENVRELSDGWVYMPIEEQKVMGITEYNAQGEFAGNNEEKREPAQQDMTGGDFRLGADMAGMTNISVKSETGEVTATFEVLPKEISQSTPQSTIVQMTERMTNNLIHSSDGNVKQMQIQLQPETLGNIVIKLESAQGEVSVKIIASNPEVRDMMAQASAQMSESIRAQGVNLSNIDVPQPSDGHENYDGSGGNPAYYNDSGDGRQKQRDENTPDYKEYMEAAENEKIRRVIDSIRSFGM